MNKAIKKAVAEMSLEQINAIERQIKIQFKRHGIIGTNQPEVLALCHFARIGFETEGAGAGEALELTDKEVADCYRNGEGGDL